MNLSQAEAFTRALPAPPARRGQAVRDGLDERTDRRRQLNQRDRGHHVLT
ncbi:hypothetical protein [Nonomuraea sp. NEAU-A123]|nr:hypothetical protein [Nonomuraea sp. NEAU-A123]MBT2229581.1 hypothetical protein [Nonomuraea sp. NEAU-A123]